MGLAGAATSSILHIKMSKKNNRHKTPFRHPSICFIKQDFMEKRILLLILLIFFLFITYIILQEISLKSRWSKMSIIYEIMKTFAILVINTIALEHLNYSVTSYSLLYLLIMLLFGLNVTVHFVLKCMKTLFSWLYTSVFVYGKT